MTSEKVDIPELMGFNNNNINSSLIVTLVSSLETPHESMTNSAFK